MNDTRDIGTHDAAREGAVLPDRHPPARPGHRADRQAAHSLRAGCATEAATRGVEKRAIVRRTRQPLDPGAARLHSRGSGLPERGRWASRPATPRTSRNLARPCPAARRSTGRPIVLCSACTPGSARDVFATSSRSNFPRVAPQHCFPLPIQLSLGVNLVAVLADYDRISSTFTDDANYHTVHRVRVEPREEHPLTDVTAITVFGIHGSTHRTNRTPAPFFRRLAKSLLEPRKCTRQIRDL